MKETAQRETQPTGGMSLAIYVIFKKSENFCFSACQHTTIFRAKLTLTKQLTEKLNFPFKGRHYRYAI